jgi:hypothetical protein
MNHNDGRLARLLGRLLPDLRVDSVFDLTSERVRGLGLDALILDIDNTLKPYTARDIDPLVRSWAAGLREASIRLSILSNGREPRVKVLAQQLGVPFAAQAMKPSPARLKALLQKHTLDRARTAIVGDQLFADVLAGRLAGVFTILVRPIDSCEPWFTRLKRPPERLLLRLALRGGRRVSQTPCNPSAPVSGVAHRDPSLGPATAGTTPQQNDREPAAQ